MNHTSNAPITQPRWRRRVAGFMVFCFGWSNLQVGVEHIYRVSLELRAAHAGPGIDPAGPLAFRPQIGVSGGGVPVIAITAPNQAGLSHNQYQRFDVDASGVILNNSQIAGNSLIGGPVTANPNLQGRPALTILNEVTHSGAPGQLNGIIEVFGSPAAVIVANPNGIVCNGCGVLNTGRFTLTTGVPNWLDANANASDFANAGQFAYDVTGGRIAVEGMGIEGTVGRLDLIGETLAIDAPLRAHYLDGSLSGITIAAGRQRFRPTDAGGVSSQPLVSTAIGNLPAGYAIDATALGAMRAGQIHILATEQGLGVNLAGPVVAFQQGIHLDSAGPVQLRQLAAAGEIQLDSDGNLSIGQDINAGGAIHINSGGSVNLNGGASAGGDLNLNSAGAIDVRGNLYSGGRVDVTTPSSLRLEGTLDAVDDIQLNSSALTLNAPLRGNGSLSIDTSADVSLAGAINVGGNANISSGGYLAIQAPIQAANDLTLIAESTRISADVTVGHDYNVNASESITLDGASHAGHGIRLTSQQLVLNGALQAPLVNLDSDSLNLGQDGLSIDGNLNLDLRGDFTLNGPLSVSGDARIESGGSQHYLSEVQAEGSLALLAGGNLTLDGSVQAGTQMILEADGDLHLHGTANADAGMRLAAGGQLQAEHAIVAGALDVSAADARFAADVAAGGDMRFRVGKLQANGSLQSGGMLDIVAGGGGVEAGNVRSNLDLIIDSQGGIHLGDADAARDLQLGAQADIDSGHLIAGRDLNLDTRGGTLQSGPIQAGGNVDIHAAGNIKLNGGLFSAQGIALLGSGSLDVNGDTQAAHGITLRAKGIALDGTLHAGGASLLDAGAGTLGIADSAYIAGATQISGRSIELAGIQSQAALQLHAGDGGYRNLGDSLVGGDYLARSGGTHSIAGTLVVVGNSDIEATGDILLGGPLEAGGDYRASSGGQLNHAGDSLILGDAQLSSVGAQHLAGSIGSAGNLTLDAGNGLRIDANVHSNGAVNLAGGSGGISIGGDLASVSDIALNADGNLEILGNARFSQGDLNSRQGAILLQGDTAANSLRLSAAQSIDLTGASVIDGNLVAQAGDIRFGQLDVSGDLSAHADANLRFLGDSRIAGQVDLSAGSAIDLQADMTLAQSLNIDTAGDFLNEGRLAVAGNLDIAARNIRSNLVADGGLIASGHLHAQASGNIALGQQGDFTAVDGIELAAVNLSHAGQMQSGGPLNFSGNSFSNSGLVAAESINLTSQLTNSGTLYGGRIDVSDHSHNSGRMAAAQLDLGSLFNSGQISGDSLRLGATANQGQIGGQNIAISGGLDNSGTLGASGLLQIDGGHVNNSGDLSGETVTIQAGMLSNSGRLRAAGNMQLTLADLNNTLAESQRCVAAPEICAQQPDTRPLTDDDFRWSQTPGEIAAGGNLQISAASLTNQGIVRSGGNFTASLTGAFQNQRSHNDLYTDAQYGQPAPAASSGILEVGGNLTLNAASLDNSGALRAVGDITLESLGDFSNTTPLPGLVGRISGRQIRIDADTVLNQGELLASAGQVQITSRDDIANQGDAARIEAFTDVRLVASNGIDNSANSNILANNLLHLAANRISNAGNLYGPAGPVAQIEILAADRFANSGSAVAGSALNLNTNQYSNTGTVGSFGDATLTLPGIWSAAANPLIAKGNLWLDVQGIAVAAGESWVSDAAWVGWNGTLVNHGSVSLNTASGNIDNLASGSRRRVGAPPADGAFLLLDAPASTDDAFNWQIDGYDDVDLRADVSIAQFNGSLTNLAADAAVGGNYVYTPNSLAQAVYWVGENAAGEVITHTGNGRSLPRLYAPGVSSIVLTGPDPGTLVADSLLLQGVDLVLPATLDTAAEADRIAQAQATQVTVQVAVAGSPVPLQADTPSAAADVAPDPLDLQPADAETPEASGLAGDTTGVGASVPPDSHLAVPAPDLADPAAGVALLRAGDGERVALAWDARRSVPGSIAAGDLALFLSGSFSNRGELAVERDLILHAAAGIDNFGAAIQAGGYLELAGDTLDNRSGSIQAQQLAASFVSDLDNSDGLIRVSKWAEIYSGGNMTASRGTFVSEGGDGEHHFLLTAAGDIHLTASNVSTQNGQVGVYAGGNITLDGLATHREREERQDTTTDTYAEQPAGADNAPLLISRRQEQEVSQVVEDGYQGSALAGQQVVVVAGGDLTALGSTIHGHERVDLAAGGDLTVRAATGTTHSETTRQLSQTDSPAWSDAGPSQAWQQTHETRTTTTLHGGLIESGGDLNLEAGGDLTLTATTLEAGGHARLAARGDIRLDSLTGEARLTSERETDAGWFGLGLFNAESNGTGSNSAESSGAGSSDFGPNGKETLQQVETQQHGSQIKAGGDLAVIAGGDARLLGADLRAEGALAVVGQNVEIAALKDRLSEDRQTQAGKTRTTTLSEHEALVGGTVSGGGEVTVLALGEAGRIDLAGVHVASDTGATRLGAQGDIAIGTVTTEHHQFSETRSKKSGFLSSKKTHTVEEGWASVAEGSLIEGATVSVDSAGAIDISGSSLVADGDVTLRAQQGITLRAAENTARAENYKQVTRSGLFSGGGLSITLGKQESTTQHDSQSTQAVASQVGSLNGNVSIQTEGDYVQTGSEVLAAGDIAVAARSLNIEAAHEIEREQLETRFKQAGLTLSLSGAVVSAAQSIVKVGEAAAHTDSGRMQALAAAGGVLAGMNAYDAVTDPASGSAVSLSLSLGAQQSQSQQARERDSVVGSTLAADGNVSLVASGAGRDSNVVIEGSQIRAGGDARLQAEGDIALLAAANTLREAGSNKSSSASIGISLGESTGITLSASSGKGNFSGAETQWSNTQVAAGKTLTLDSGGDTHLKGATASGHQVVAQIGGDLTIESLQDTATFHSRQKSSGGSLTLGPVPGASLSFDKSQIDSDFASVGTQSGIKAGDGGFDVVVNGKTDLIGGVISSTQVAVDAGNNRWVTGSLSTQDIENQATYQADAYGVTLGVGSLRSTSDAGIGQDDGQSRSSSRAGISNVAGDTGVRSDDASTGLAPIFDKTRVQDELDAQVTITRTFSREGSVAWGHYANDRFTEAAARGDEEATACWGPDGACRAGGHVLIGGAAGGWGGATGAGLTSVTAPHVAGFLIQQGVAPETATMLTQLLALGGGVAVGGASGGAGGLNEVSHNAGALITFVTKLAEQGQRLGPAGLRQLSQANQAVLRACATSTVCKNLLPPTAAVWLSGQITLENQAHQPSLADLIPGNGFGAGGQPKPVGPLAHVPPRVPGSQVESYPASESGQSSSPPGYAPTSVDTGPLVSPNLGPQGATLNLAGAEGGGVKGGGKTEVEILSGSKPSHINGSIGELRGYQSAIDDLGQIGIQQPGKITAPGPDFITYDPVSESVVVWDAKYRAPGGSYPSALPADKINSWMPQVRESIQNLPAGSVRDAAMTAIQNGQIRGRIFQWPN